MSIGTIPYYGFGFTMFPFAGRKPGYAQLRVGAPSLAKLLTRLYPAVWRGKFRDDKLTRDFRELVESHNGQIIGNPEGAFKESGTMVNTVTVVIRGAA